MNKTDRMLAIILKLQSKGMQRAEDLAATFETSVRTIYRDMQALSEAKVPIVGSPGIGYSLIEGYFLPPVSITADEAATLLLGLEFIDQQFDHGYLTHADSVRKKIEAVLTKKVREEANRLRSGIKLDTSSRRDKHMSDVMAKLRKAVNETKQVCFRYSKKASSPGGDQSLVRIVNPYGLVFRNGTWTLIAFCHHRQEMRHFTLRKMYDVELMDRTFQIPLDFHLQTYSPSDRREEVVRVQVQPHLALTIMEYDYFYVDTVEENSNGLIMTLRVYHPEDVLQWVMSWGNGIVVLEPDSLREKVKIEAEQIAKSY